MKQTIGTPLFYQKNKICDTDRAGIQIAIEMQSQRHSFNMSDSGGLQSRV
jgi:hypothetical protein